ncbi:hypothetical protein [Nocardia cyriacigeorgica]|uniref:hypothetical protein n=1 Tax=Nocardia cyriacigeorgica TaxID=135487 RepID=UPI0013D31C84|nr:hypothetical protein [Nocardia cyriacigeorgica]MBF6440139.1 hypothetical protein [Nocardia cyriacigeorgica]MBF6456983.1 hypothetical protein [Nocardia cyriacigeorgica]MBF6479449.1 hypothetical protein [Nocardia cyriacigeorgica]MBF6554356.1 hypothetical protein [Nocardia cyriacigeorgica]NEW26844.1 hypothetical protein [Nocardia cyriacigeorgica]
MAICDTCGNDYDKSFTVSRDGQSWTFDSFECAASRLAPACAHCGCRVLGHGVEAGQQVYCCAHCARRAGHDALVDHV